MTASVTGAWPSHRSPLGPSGDRAPVTAVTGSLVQLGRPARCQVARYLMDLVGGNGSRLSPFRPCSVG